MSNTDYPWVVGLVPVGAGPSPVMPFYYLVTDDIEEAWAVWEVFGGGADWVILSSYGLDRAMFPYLLGMN